jgi:hypothetical protein
MPETPGRHVFATSYIRMIAPPAHNHRPALRCDGLFEDLAEGLMEQYEPRLSYGGLR